MSKLLYAYLAGAIDSDGTIGIKRNTYSMRIVGDSKQPTYSERVALRQVGPEIVTALRDAFGGSLYITKPGSPNGRPLQSWAATDLRACDCLKAIRPFLRVKTSQADNAMALRVLKQKSAKLRVAKGRGHVGSAPRPPELSKAMESLYQEAKRLNRVGVR